jgi:signal transduction histidine kinase
MPKGHLPVVSFLSVPVISKSGEVIGALFFGHPQKGVFTEEAERLVIGVASQAAIAIDNAKLFEEVKKANLENEKLLLQAQNQNFKKDEFLSIASHELKTPVTSMKGYIQILEKQSQKDNNEFYKNFISKAHRQLSKITVLVNDLLDISKIESGKMTYTFTAFKVGDILEDCISTIANVDTVHTIRIFGDPEMEIYADRNRIEQVIINLLSNAIKYSPKASEVLIGLSGTEKHFKLEVRDFGPGIAEDKLNSVFDRFYRGEENSYTTSGLGLGLFIAAEIIKRHGGKIGVESEVGKGSNFWFMLPDQSE